MDTATFKPWKWEQDGMSVVRSIARTGPGCHEGCGVLLYVKNGELIHVEGDPDYPLNRGRLCPRCLSLTQTVYHPDRLLYPLKRVGERGEGRWQQILWDEAYGLIADKFLQIKKETGPESVIFCSGTARDGLPFLSRLTRYFGSPNQVNFGPLHGHACYAPKIASMAALFGGFAVADCAQAYPERYDHPEWKPPRCIIIWGNNPLPSSADGFLGHWIIDCMRQGAELIVIDPRRTLLASRAKVWLQNRPGTDAAIAMAMLYVIINEKLYDADFVNKWTYGFDDLARRVQDYPPERAAAVSGVPAEKITEAARLYAGSHPASVQWGVALDQSKECIPTLHAIIDLWSICGNMDVPGGNILRGRLFGMGKYSGWGAEAISLETKKRKIGNGIYPFKEWMGLFPQEALFDQIESGQPYPIRGSWIQGTNTFTCGAADAWRVYRDFKKIEFNVVIDLFMNPTAMAFGDIVLPTTTYAERDGLPLPVGSVTCIGTTNKAIEPRGECRSDMQIDMEMGRRLNPAAWPWRDVQEMFTEMLQANTGLTFAQLRDRGYLFDRFDYRKYEKGLLRKDGQPGFETPTGKIELYSTVLEQCKLDPLPYYDEPLESPLSTPELARDYPLVLTTGARTWSFFHSEHRMIPNLRGLNPDPLVELHPDTAGKLGVRDGDWVYIETRYGRCKERARVTSGILPNVAMAQHGWWYPEKPGPEPNLFGVWESNINQLLPSGWTGKSGFGYPFKNQMCRIYKVEAPNA